MLSWVVVYGRVVLFHLNRMRTEQHRGDVQQGFGFLVRDEAYMTSPGGLITIEWLMNKAASARDAYQDLLGSAGDGFDEELAASRELMEAAVLCAHWLQTEGGSPRAYVGPFGPPMLCRGDKVLVRPGAIIMSSDPGKPAVTSMKRQSVVVTESYRGYIQRSALSEGALLAVVQARIVWAGGGGHTRWTDANNVVTVTK